MLIIISLSLKKLLFDERQIIYYNNGITYNELNYRDIPLFQHALRHNNFLK